MNKPKVTLMNWELYVYNGYYSLSGTADMHPVLGKNATIFRTSSMLDWKMTDDVLIYETRNTVYYCPLKYMTQSPYRTVMREYVEELSHLNESSDSQIDHIIAAAAKLARENNGIENYPDDAMLSKIRTMQIEGSNELEQKRRQEADHLISIARQYEDCIYIEMSNIKTGNQLAYHLGDSVGTVDPSLHAGMFQDSVLYMKYASEEDPVSLDFRYFPRGCSLMESYSWSDNIRHVVIKNATDCELYFNKMEIPIGETKAFTEEGHVEQLISPDCHNGKSAFFMNK